MRPQNCFLVLKPKFFVGIIMLIIPAKTQNGYSEVLGSIAKVAQVLGVHKTRI